MEGGGGGGSGATPVPMSMNLELCLLLNVNSEIVVDPWCCKGACCDREYLHIFSGVNVC